ncbi:hypothetical protein [Nocardioides malaquae]|uniref:hypothetical protein n=1 Tax=Nocardioides malaquae TaxID=2773426 RepID=UPI001D0D2E7C|nr:hypothetical protein [Nocardioides malaquae]
MTPPFTPSRRTVVRTAAWSVPVVAVSAAAPAFAASTVGLTYNPGGSAPDFDGAFYNYVFRGASLTFTGDAGPSTLTLTVTFEPTSGAPLVYTENTAPTGWTLAPRPGGNTDPVVFTYQTQVRGGDVVPIEDGLYFGNDVFGQEGTFVLTFRALGFPDTQWLAPTS